MKLLILIALAFALASCTQKPPKQSYTECRKPYDCTDRPGLRGKVYEPAPDWSEKPDEQQESVTAEEVPLPEEPEHVQESLL
ncbi:MAG: hypothetical protein KAT62_00660 [Desulfuromonadales bacterium]|nr:hypothetical protein [Desulfuromonadales bacterium]